METKHPLLKSFGFAYEGIKTEFKKGRNFRIQIMIGMLATAMGLVLGISTQEWIVLILLIAIVLILELVNTAIEEIINIVSPEIRPEAKIAKDVSAGAVLIASVAAILIGVTLFLPKILSL